MSDAAERLQDALTRHEIDIERLKTGTALKFEKLLRKADTPMVAELRRQLDELGETTNLTPSQLRELDRVIKAVVDTRRASWIEIRREAKKELTGIGRMEAGISNELFDEAVGLKEFTPESESNTAINAAVVGSVFLGRNSAQHLKALELRERQIIETTIRQGVVEGVGAEALVTQLRGSRAFAGTDGALNTVRRGMNSLMASAVIDAATVSREAEFAATGVITGLIWTAVLDGRTTPICQSRDGKGVKFTDDFPANIPLLNPPGARPPAHFNCRSFMEAVIRDIGIVKPHRTFVTDTRTNKARKVDFRKQAKADAGSNWSSLTERQRRRKIRAVSNDWARDNIGTVAPRTTYADFLERQSPSFQDGVLGPTRGQLFREGGLTVDNFVDNTGQSLTLEQLQAAYPGAFDRAGF